MDFLFIRTVISNTCRRALTSCVRCRRSGRAADVLVRDTGAVRRLSTQQAAAQRPGRLPARAGAQGNAVRAPQRRAARARAHALPRVGAAAPPQLPGRAAVPQLLLGAPRPTGTSRPPLPLRAHPARYRPRGVRAELRPARVPACYCFHPPF